MLFGLRVPSLKHYAEAKGVWRLLWLEPAGRGWREQGGLEYHLV